MRSKKNRGDQMTTSSGCCGSQPDPFGDLPAELRPQSAAGSNNPLRSITCPGCGVRYSTNRLTDLCPDCERRGIKPSGIEGEKPTMLTIKVLGSGCPNCKRLEQHARLALEQLGIEAKVEHVTDVSRFVDYGLMSTPGLVIDEKLVSSGKVLAPASIVALIREAQAS
jgi:small redox-active disulfide protein 2